MTARLISASVALLLILVSSAGFAVERKKYEILKPVTPCLFFLDEETGEPTGNPANAPCDLDATRVNPGDTVDPELRKKYGKAFEPQQKKAESQSKVDHTR